MGAMHVLPVHGHPDRDRGQNQHRDADVPVRDADGEDDEQDDEAHTADTTGCVSGLLRCAMWSPGVGREARPESAWEAMAEVEAHAPFWPTVRGSPSCTRMHPQ